MYLTSILPNIITSIFCISGEGRKRSQLSHPATSDYTLGGTNVDLAGMIGVLKTPSGGSEPCLLKKMPDGQLGGFKA